MCCDLCETHVALAFVFPPNDTLTFLGVFPTTASLFADSRTYLRIGLVPFAASLSFGFGTHRIRTDPALVFARVRALGLDLFVDVVWHTFS